MTDDFLLRIHAREAGLRGLICQTTKLVNDARSRHEAGPAASAALGYGLTAGALLGALLKVQQRVALKVEANGPLRKLVVEADSYGRVRGYVAAPNAQLPPAVDPADLTTTLGDVGLLTVVKDLRLKELYEGVVPLQTGRLDSDLVYYLHQSEQSPSLIELDVKLTPTGEVAVAGGLLVQTLPGAEMDALRTVAERLDDQASLAELLDQGQSPEAILANLFAGIAYETLDQTPLRFECSCSWERSEQALIAMGREELATLIDEGQAVIDCYFCRRRFLFGREALETILEKVE